MIEIDLITGFLGAGKTTFIRKYAEYLIESGYRVGIIENDFGAVNIDMLMLQDVMGDACEVEQIVGGNIVADWKRRFRTKLISMAMRGFQRILVEPSGIYDVDAFFDVLYEEPVDNWYRVGNIFTIVDAGLEETLSKQEEYLCVSQIANTGKVILSKVQETTPEQAKACVERLNQMLLKFKCKRQLSEEEIFCKNWEMLSAEDFEKLMRTGYKKSDFEKLWFDQNKEFGSLFYMHVHISEDKLREIIREIFENPLYGEVCRIKGYLPTEDGKWLQLNATAEHCVMKKVDRGQEIVIVIGRGLDSNRLAEKWRLV